MAFGGFSEDTPTQPMAEINMVPLIDVMLVLLIIFIITAPLLTHVIKIDLPRAPGVAAPEKPEIITLVIAADGALYWNNAPISQVELDYRLAAVAQHQPQPELRLRADQTTPYQKLAEVMAAAQNAGITKMGFVTEPVAPTP